MLFAVLPSDDDREGNAVGDVSTIDRRKPEQ
jgi:hypothetical protein